MSSEKKDKSAMRRMSNFLLANPASNPNESLAQTNSGLLVPNPSQEQPRGRLNKGGRRSSAGGPATVTLKNASSMAGSSMDVMALPPPPVFAGDDVGNPGRRAGSAPATNSRNALRPSSRSGSGQNSGPSSRPVSRPGSSRGPAITSGATGLLSSHTPEDISLTQNIERLNTFSLESEKKVKKRGSWFPGSRPASANTQQERQQPRAWIAGHADIVAYDVTSLANATRVAELWDDSCDTFVHLFPQATGKGPSFRISSSLFASSPTLAQLAHGDIYSKHRSQRGKHKIRRGSVGSSDRQVSSQSTPQIPPLFGQQPQTQLSSRVPFQDGSDTTSTSSSRSTRANLDEIADESSVDIHLYVPVLSTGGYLSGRNTSEARISEDDIEALVNVRNMFAFLLGGPLVATPRRPTVFQIFLKISDSLKAYGFTNLDGSTFGEVAAASFDAYVHELNLADLRMSREKTIEALVLGEKMRSVFLYNDAFVHAVGRFSDIQQVAQLEIPRAKYSLISPTTLNRMERASIDLDIRIKSVNLRLSDFDFPSIFTGTLNSRSVDERKTIRFSAWKDIFLSFRKHVLGYYKDRYGAWPPKASSKKNNLETSGLNRIVLRALYRDFADLYDLWCDRTSLTSRTNNDFLAAADDNPAAPIEPVNRVLRRVFDEYDRSTPPIQPPIPYDTPLLPRLPTDVAQDAKSQGKKLRDDQLAAILDGATNADTRSTVLPRSTFLQSVHQFERRAARGSNITQLADLRAGMWIFLYAVMQALPMLVVDAPSVRFTTGVEYFLCEPPRSGVPWANPEQSATGRATRNWYEVESGTGVVSLPSDLVEHGVEGVFRRSHCWLKAKQWTEEQTMGTQADVTGGRMRAAPDVSQPASIRTGSNTSQQPQQQIWSNANPAASMSSWSSSSHDRNPSGPFDANLLGTTLGAPADRQVSAANSASTSSSRRTSNAQAYSSTPLPCPPVPNPGHPHHNHSTSLPHRKDASLPSLPRDPHEYPHPPHHAATLPRAPIEHISEPIPTRPAHHHVLSVPTLTIPPPPPLRHASPTGSPRLTPYSASPQTSEQRPSSQGRTPSSSNPLSSGLEALPLPRGVHPAGYGGPNAPGSASPSPLLSNSPSGVPRGRKPLPKQTAKRGTGPVASASTDAGTTSTGKTFDDIIASMESEKQKKKKGKK